jgi:aspartate racemase
MKTIGLIGGMTWFSTLEYYRIINETIKEKLGGLHSAKCFLYSFDFDVIGKYQMENQWEKLTELMISASKNLEKAGADFIVICANTMHKTSDAVENNINIPVLNIIDVTADEIMKKGVKKVGLLGTRFTMEEDFFKKRLTHNYDIEVILPEKKDRDIINDIIYKELSKGFINPASKQKYLKIIDRILNKNAKGIILGCTEIPLLIKQNDVEAPVFDTTYIHAKAAVDYALK